MGDELEWLQENGIVSIRSDPLTKEFVATHPIFEHFNRERFGRCDVYLLRKDELVYPALSGRFRDLRRNPGRPRPDRRSSVAQE